MSGSEEKRMVCRALLSILVLASLLALSLALVQRFHKHLFLIFHQQVAEHQKNTFSQPLDPVTASDVTRLIWGSMLQEVATEHFLSSAMSNIILAKFGNEILSYLSSRYLRSFSAPCALFVRLPFSLTKTLFSYADMILK